MLAHASSEPRLTYRKAFHIHVHNFTSKLSSRPSHHSASHIPPATRPRNLRHNAQASIHNSLDQTLPLILAIIISSPGLRPHRRQHIVIRRQAHKQGKRHEPDTDAKVARNLREGWDVGPVVVRRHLAEGFGLGIGEVLEPDVVVQEYEAFFVPQGQLGCFMRTNAGEILQQDSKNRGSVSWTKGKRRMLPR
jgi:hypothetical protein